MATGDSTILHELLALQKESNERDSRIESKMDGLDIRMKNIEVHSDKQDKQIEKLTEILTDQKIMSHNLSELTISVGALSRRVSYLEKKNGEMALSLWKKILGTVLTGILTATVGFVIGHIKIGD